MTEPVRYLSAERMTSDDFGVPFTMQPGEVVYDAATERPGGYAGSWATMTSESYMMHGFGKLGTGYGQKYVRQENGELHKVEG
jgi:hypothetical protein